MTPQIAKALLDMAKDGVGLRQAIASAGLNEKEALRYMQRHHREDYRSAKAQGAPKARIRFLEARKKARA